MAASLLSSVAVSATHTKTVTLLGVLRAGDARGEISGSYGRGLQFAAGGVSNSLCGTPGGDADVVGGRCITHRADVCPPTLRSTAVWLQQCASWEVIADGVL